MTTSADGHLERLADDGALRALSEMDLGWVPADRQAAAALRFKRTGEKVPTFVGLVGGASSGKSTLFNSLIEREVSRISAHAHETLGPIAAVHVDWMRPVVSWIRDRLVFCGLASVSVNGSGPVTGEPETVTLTEHVLADRANVVFVDLPDVTTKRSTDEGSVTRMMLPWFDGLVIVVDEERWFDATVFDDTMSVARGFGPLISAVFNQTERAGVLSVEDRGRLTRQAESLRASDSCVSPFAPGAGYRPVDNATRDRVLKWTERIDGGDRTGALSAHLQRRCADVLRENVDRSQHFNELRSAVEGELASLTMDTSLSADLLTGEERLMLGAGHRFVPLYDMVAGLRRKWDRLRNRTGNVQDVDFEKSVDLLADVLRRNVEHRFTRATDAVDRVLTTSKYTQADWSARWEMPPFDEKEWARRIRTHIEAWKAETSKQSRQGDLAAVALGTPLLLADLLFLGGAGTTLTWSVAWIAGFFGGKGLVRVIQGSPAFKEYQTTVGAYQAWLREALADQCESNLASLPRRHLPMTDPILEAVLFWSTPREH
jgi:50S ribosome-binding GTPase